MKKKAIITVLFAMLFVAFLSGAVDNEKALALIKKGNESYREHKIPSQAFAYFKQAADLASGAIKVDALLQAAYMSHLQGNKVAAYQGFIKEALRIDPEKRLEPADYQSSFRQIFNDIKSREKIAKTAPAPAQPSLKKEAGSLNKSRKPLSAKAAEPFKYFVKLSYAMGLPGSDQKQSWTEPLYGENTEYGLTSKPGSSSSFGLGLGYNLGKSMAVALGAIIYSSDLDATVSASVPSPWVFSAPRTASGAYATSLKANIVYLNLIYKFAFGKLNLDLFAGPAYFMASTDVLSAVAIQDVFPNETVTMSFTTENIKKSSIGFSGGLDLAYFFSANLGVFVEGRYLYGSGTFTPASQKVPGITLTVGGPGFGAGLVFRF
jgi:hypothetical protein